MARATSAPWRKFQAVMQFTGVFLGVLMFRNQSGPGHLEECSSLSCPGAAAPILTRPVHPRAFSLLGAFGSAPPS